MSEDTPTGPGAAVRGYRIERLIGTGGAAAVYEARRLAPGGPGERVACKVVHTERRDEPRDREQVRQEAVLGLRVTAGRRNLVEILDFFDDAEAQHCIVMELVDGASVSELRGPDRRLPFPVARRVAVEVLEALVYLHGRGVLHRDLSPRNILVTAGGVVKVADLGIARVMEQGLVHTETIRGTPMYVAREAVELLPLDARVDLFSLGAVLYDLVTGTPPCGDHNLVAEMLVSNAGGQFAPLPPETPADLAKLITGLLPPDRDARRPQTAAEALALLRRHAQPMASEEELAGMVPSAQERRDRELADDRPANALAPGHVLAPRDALAAVKAPAGRVAGHVARLEAGAMLDRAAGAVPDRRTGDAVPHHVDDSLPDCVAEHAIDAAAERIVDAVAEHVVDAEVERAADAAPSRAADAVPGRVTESVSGRAGGGVGRPGTARRFVVRRVVLVAVSMACGAVLGSLLDDGFRGEQTAIQRTAPGEVRAPVIVPTPALPVVPVAPVPVAPGPEVQETRPPRATDHADAPRRKHMDGQRGVRRIGRARGRGTPVPLGDEPPPWGTP